ncbi:MAG: baseplate J/gp47 family protein [Myxococcota bacterium]
MAGVTSTGFEAKTTEDLIADLEESFRRVFGKSINVSAEARPGQVVSLMADALAETWAVAEAASSASDPSGAAGVLLDNLAALTGTVRLVATRSTVTLVAVGTPGTFLATGRRASVSDTTTVFETTADATLSSPSAWLATTLYAAGAFIQSSGSVWVAVVGGTSGSIAPSGVGPTFDDGSVRWQRLGTGLGYALVPAQATVTGPLQGFAGSITTIETPVAGWNAVNNLLDAAPGRNLETDPELRVRRQREIAGIGTSPQPALQAQLLRVAGVTSCTVFENTADVTVDGVPPHAVECLIEGGADAELRSAIFAGVAAGIETAGGVSGSVTDSAGNPHTVKFSRPASVSLWVKVTLTKNPAEYPLDGDAQVAAAIVTAGNARGLGVDVVASRIAGDIFKAAPGVLDVTAVLIGTSNPPISSATVGVSLRQRASFDTSRVTVVATNGVP